MDSGLVHCCGEDVMLSDLMLGRGAIFFLVLHLALSSCWISCELRLNKATIEVYIIIYGVISEDRLISVILYINPQDYS
jgi:hypothetical protein